MFVCNGLCCYGYSVSGKKGDRDADILIMGMSSRNRAVHGDLVVVEILPRSQWLARSQALKDLEPAKGIYAD